MKSSQRVWQLKMKSLGKCVQCGKKSRKNKSLCKKCAEKSSIRTSVWAKENPGYSTMKSAEFRERNPDYYKNYHISKKILIKVDKSKLM